MVRLHEWSAPSFNPTTRTLGGTMNAHTTRKMISAEA